MGSDQGRSSRRLLALALMLVATVALAGLAFRSLGAEAVLAERQAREVLRGRAASAAAALQAAAIEAVREAGAAPQAVVSTNGALIDPPEPRALEALEPVEGRDPEGGFYLDAAERAEARDADRERAAMAYRAAADPGRDRLVRALAQSRLAALHERRGAAVDAELARRSFLELLEGDERLTREALIARVRQFPIQGDAGIGRDLLALAGGPDEAVARGLLALVCDEAAAVDELRARNARLAAARALASSILPAATTAREGAIARDGRLLAWTSRDGRIAIAERPLPSSPEGVTVDREDAPEPDGPLVERAAAGEPARDLSVRALLPAEALAQVTRGRRLWTVGLLVALAAGGGLAALFTVRALREQARGARERAALLAQVGHDFRTPLAKIRLYAETLAGGRVPDAGQAREFAEIVAREAERLSAMAGQVLDFARLDAPRAATPRKAVDLGELAAEVVRAHEPLLARAGIRAEVHSEGAPVAAVDADAIRGALANLVENVRHHAAGGGIVEIATAGRNGQVEIRVVDRGPGIPAEIRDRIFERFVRGPDASAHGAGLGLALVREVARAHGGEVEARGREGGGAEFVLRIPRNEAAA